MSNRTAEFRAITSKLPSAAEKPKKENHREDYDLFIKEAHRIYQHIASLKRFLLSIRRAYLSSDSKALRRNRTKQKQSGDTVINSTSSSSLFALFPTDITFLTDNERDEIDFQAKMIIQRCMDRIEELEEAEKLRQAKEAAKPASRLASFFGNIMLPSTSVEDVLAVHRSSITWLLNNKLTEVSKIQKEQQEIRVTREIEKSENRLFHTSMMMPSATNFEASSVRATIPTNTVWDQGEDQQQQIDAFEEQLSKEELQMLEEENSQMLEELSNALNQVRSAEKALLEISTLQSQLTNHLAAQTIQTDKLYEEAIATTQRVEHGNLQLIKTREHNRGARKFMLLFLIVASLVLLFLDWYS
ncbi:hypothetical protein EC973_002255 [Apophysomyces ossiformis]|uniref:SNARE-complex protein Syntaxin-18 N-terminal domain-containing protein n=1 Tax=Apophysomyces ossiformis TaxID=679940 RepID=A0A8H7C053_9FUNG|nr:hypothetical protein EC973_002255 [Apophysomyces ossiformis]